MKVPTILNIKVKILWHSLAWSLFFHLVPPVASLQSQVHNSCLHIFPFAPCSCLFLHSAADSIAHAAWAIALEALAEVVESEIETREIDFYFP